MAKKNFMQLDCTDEMLEFVNLLDNTSCWAVSIWLRTIIQLRMLGGSCDLLFLLQQYRNPHMSFKMARTILEVSGFFAIDDAKQKITLSEKALAFFRASASNQKPEMPSNSENSGKHGSDENDKNSHVDTPEQDADLHTDTPDQCADLHAAPLGQGANSHADPPGQGANSHAAPPSNAHAYRDRDKEIENKNKDRDKRKKLEKRIDVSILLTCAKTEEEKNFYEQMFRSYPRICAMEKPLTYEDFQKLCNKYPQPKVVTVMQAMENRRTLNRQYLSADCFYDIVTRKFFGYIREMLEEGCCNLKQVAWRCGWRSVGVMDKVFCRYQLETASRMAFRLGYGEIRALKGSCSRKWPSARRGTNKSRELFASRYAIGILRASYSHRVTRLECYARVVRIALRDWNGTRELFASRYAIGMLRASCSRRVTRLECYARVIRVALRSRNTSWGRVSIF